jgi:hypothetical protein
MTGLRKAEGRHPSGPPRQRPFGLWPEGFGEGGALPEDSAGFAGGGALPDDSVASV